jgi:hypothetical protein
MRETMNNRFYELVKNGWNINEMENKAEYIDEIFVGAVISALSDKDFVLLDIMSDGNNHYFMLENLETRHRIKILAYSTTHTLPEIKTVGAKAYIIFSYGAPIKKSFSMIGGIRYESLSRGLTTIGSISFDYDNYYLYVNCPLYLLINDYVEFDTLDVDTAKLSNDLDAIFESLNEYLKTRIEVE